MTEARGTAIILWVLSALLAALYLYTGVPKILGVGEAVQGFQRFGYPVWFRVLIGVVEVGGALGLLLPPVAFYAAGALGVVMIGATYTHLVKGITGATIPIVCLFVLAAIAYLRRPAARGPGAGASG